ncbi:MAG: AraC family transcriptional regulator [Planctomycetes bacterium]|nr:AraC family transcriptional regulator [Planctomycetota bacterium]
MPLLFDKIARHTDDYLSIDDLATAENISERTFWNMFLEYFGVLL